MYSFLTLEKTDLLMRGAIIIARSLWEYPPSLNLGQ